MTKTYSVRTHAAKARSRTWINRKVGFPFGAVVVQPSLLSVTVSNFTQHIVGHYQESRLSSVIRFFAVAKPTVLAKELENMKQKLRSPGYINNVQPEVRTTSDRMN